MQKKLAALEIELANSKDSYTTIDTVTDTKTGVENNRITPGGAIVIAGTNIRIAGQHPDNGLHFTNIQTGEITTVNETLAKNTRKSIIFTAPELEDGAYNLSLITQDVGGGNRSKTPRKTVFRNTLTVMHNTINNTTNDTGMPPSPSQG
jgi:hypothetical protein